MMQNQFNEETLRVLSLDGGGTKGAYSLGVLYELEKAVGAPLFEKFDLVYGTSTGAIIGSLIGLGYSIDEIKTLYWDWIPSVFKLRSSRKKSTALRKFGEKVFGDTKFDSFRTNVGIVTSDFSNGRARIFKSNVGQVFSREASFEPGFGATILDAVMASAAATPYFEEVAVSTTSFGTLRLRDGGFVAGNPSMFALTDATEALGYLQQDVRLVSIGTGQFANPDPTMKDKLINKIDLVTMLTTMMDMQAKSTEFLTSQLFDDVKMVRLNRSDSSLQMSILSYEVEILDRAFDLGRETFGNAERGLVSLLDN